MRARQVRKIGNSWYLKLEPTDLKDFEIIEGDFLNIEEANVVPDKFRGKIK